MVYMASKSIYIV